MACKLANAHTPPRAVHISLALLLTTSTMLLAAPTDNGDLLRGIAFISITTDDVDLSLRFYTQVMGGMQIKDLSFRFHGDEHYEILFHKELEMARNQNLDPTQYGVPDIRDNGTYEVQGEFVVFDNALIQLVEFSVRDGPNAGSPFPAYENNTSPGYIAAPHICFWVQDGVDFNHYVAQLEARSAALGFSKVKASRPIKVHSEAERLAVPESQIAINFQAGDFAGLSLSFFKGPSGERLEVYRITNQARALFGREYCRRRAVSTAFIDNYFDNQYKRQAGVPGQHFGLIHFGTRSDDLWRSVNFYMNVLRGDLIRPPLQGIDIRGEPLQNLIFTKELLDAESLQVAPRDIGVADISENSNMRYDFRMEQFDNIEVEMTYYTDGKEMGDPVFAPRYNHTSLAYVNDMYLAFMLDSDADMAAYVTDLDGVAASNGFRQVKVNRAPGPERKGYVAFTEGPLSGLSYSMLSGAAGEHVAIVQFAGQAREKLRRALVQYGAVSTAFPETNPWATGSMDAFCAEYAVQSTCVNASTGAPKYMIGFYVLCGLASVIYVTNGVYKLLK